MESTDEGVVSEQRLDPAAESPQTSPSTYLSEHQFHIRDLVNAPNATQVNVVMQQIPDDIGT
jgi:hypothetical protein